MCDDTFIDELVCICRPPEDKKVCRSRWRDETCHTLKIMKETVSTSMDLLWPLSVFRGAKCAEVKSGEQVAAVWCVAKHTHEYCLLELIHPAVPIYSKARYWWLNSTPHKTVLSLYFFSFSKAHHKLFAKISEHVIIVAQKGGNRISS